MLVKYRIKVQLFNLGFVGQNNDPLSFAFYSFYFVLLSLCLELSILLKDERWNFWIHLIFIFDFILNLYYFYCTCISLIDSNSVTRNVWKEYLQNALGISIKVERIYFYFESQIWIYYFVNSIYFPFYSICYKSVDCFYRKKSLVPFLGV